MDFKTITENQNPLFNRKEIEGEIHADATPSREEVLKIISEKFSAKPDTIKIKTIKGKFGQKVFLIVANIYNSKEDMDKVELKKKKDLELEKKQAEPKTEEKQPEQEEKPAEEKTEDMPKEDEEVKPEEKVEEKRKGE